MLEIYTKSHSNPRPYIHYPITCGDPLENDSPVEWLSLDDYVANSSDSVLYVRVRGESMVDVGIESGDLVVVDRLMRAENGSTVLARLGTGYTIKKYQEIDAYEKRKLFYLVPANPDFPRREIKRKDDFEILGVVTHIVKKVVK